MTRRGRSSLENREPVGDPDSRGAGPSPKEELAAPEHVVATRLPRFFFEAFEEDAVGRAAAFPLRRLVFPDDVEELADRERDSVRRLEGLVGAGHEHGGERDFRSEFRHCEVLDSRGPLPCAQICRRNLSSSSRCRYHPPPFQDSPVSN